MSKKVWEIPKLNELGVRYTEASSNLSTSFRKRPNKPNKPNRPNKPNCSSDSSSSSSSSSKCGGGHHKPNCGHKK